MKEIYLVSQIIAPCAITVENGVIISAPKVMSNFIGQSFSILEQSIAHQNRKFIIEKVEDL